MRLIDADELKKALAKNITIWNFNVSYDGILAEIIDNAQTVEAHDTVNMYCDKDAQIIVEQIRPQGKWIYICSYANTHLLRYDCSKCGRTVDVYKRQELLAKYPFCHCGADMRKEDNP